MDHTLGRPQLLVIKMLAQFLALHESYWSVGVQVGCSWGGVWVQVTYRDADIGFAVCEFDR